MVALTLIQILQVLLDVVWWIIVIQFVLSLLIAFNVINTHSGFVRSLHTGLDRLTEPLYRPIRRLLPNLQGLDLSPAIVLVAIAILQIILRSMAYSAAASAV